MLGKVHKRPRGSGVFQRMLFEELEDGAQQLFEFGKINVSQKLVYLGFKIHGLWINSQKPAVKFFSGDHDYA